MSNKNRLFHVVFSSSLLGHLSNLIGATWKSQSRWQGGVKYISIGVSRCLRDEDEQHLSDEDYNEQVAIESVT